MSEPAAPEPAWIRQDANPIEQPGIAQIQTQPVRVGGRPAVRFIHITHSGITTSYWTAEEMIATANNMIATANQLTTALETPTSGLFLPPGVQH